YSTLSPHFLFLFHCHDVLSDLPSFPTRRSSDLTIPNFAAAMMVPRLTRRFGNARLLAGGLTLTLVGMAWLSRITAHSSADSSYRSEEHTSELQSRVDLVCRLLLEKKKKIQL